MSNVYSFSYNYGPLESPENGDFVIDYSTETLIREDPSNAFGQNFTSVAFNPATNQYAVSYSFAGEKGVEQSYDFTYTGMNPSSFDTVDIKSGYVGSNGLQTSEFKQMDVPVTVAEGDTVNPVCFASGTLIRTTRGDVAVEHLAIGDHVVTASGVHRIVRWTGCRVVERPAIQHHPVRIRSGGFGAGLPQRDLLLSPGHPVLVGADANGCKGYLVPIMCLINGTTIARASLETVTYWHVELDEHDVLLAEGLPAESYFDLGLRSWFSGADDLLFNPDAVSPGMPGRCRPVVIEGPVVEAERRRLDIVFTMQLQAQCAWAAVKSPAFCPQ